MPTSALIDGRQSLNRFAVELSYSGLHVPEALLADLARAGWEVPPTPPRPASAIDWSTPDAAAGTSYTIRDWQVEGVVLGPPEGSGIGGRWTDDERMRRLQATRRALHRHGVVPQEVGVGEEPVHAPAAVAVAPGTTERAAPAGATVEVLAVLTADRSQVFSGLVQALGSTCTAHPAIAASTEGVGVRARAAARPDARWLEAELLPEQMASQGGGALLSSPLFRHALWIRPTSAADGPAHGTAQVPLRAIVPADAAERVSAAVGSLCGIHLERSPVQANGGSADILVEGAVERLLFDAVCAEIVRISDGAICRGVSA